MERGMQGKKISRVELSEHGWFPVPISRHLLPGVFVFEDGNNGRIAWNVNTQIVEYEYQYIP
ncbi:MAG: hypothetical protein ABH956_01310 [Candidatus Nealsonbacteria bacterium]